MGRTCFGLFFGPPRRCPSNRTLNAQRRGPARARLWSVPLRPQLRSPEGAVVGAQRAVPVAVSSSPPAACATLTRTGLAQMFLQQRLLQQELKPAGLRRGAGPAGGGRLPVRRLRAHPAPAAGTPRDASRLQPDTRTREPEL